MSIVWYKILPAHFGGQKGIADFNEALGKEFILYCVCSKNNEPGSAKNYQVFNWLPVSKTQVANPFVWLKLLRFVKKQNVTHVILEHPYYALAARFIKRFANCTVITHSHNIEYTRFKNTEKAGWRLIKWLEGIAYKQSHLVLFKTSQDARFAIIKWALNAGKCMVMLYGITQKDLAQKKQCRAAICERHAIPADHKILLFNGTLDYKPNADAVFNIVNQLLPLLRQKQAAPFTFIITGRCQEKAYQHLRKITAENLVMAGYVEDVEEYFLAADVYVNAVNEGGGVQTKTLEALSYQLNVVCFENVLNGVDGKLVRGKLFIATPNDWHHFTNCLIEATEGNFLLPSVFFSHYSSEGHISELKKRIENQNN